MAGEVSAGLQIQGQRGDLADTFVLQGSGIYLHRPQPERG